MTAAAQFACANMLLRAPGGPDINGRPLIRTIHGTDGITSDRCKVLSFVQPFEPILKTTVYPPPVDTDWPVPAI
jgi:hypothetical protein